MPEAEPENECGINAYLDTNFTICLCEDGWFKNQETGVCSEEKSIFEQVYDDIMDAVDETTDEKVAEYVRSFMSILTHALLFFDILLIILVLRQMVQKDPWLKEYKNKTELQSFNYY